MTSRGSSQGTLVAIPTPAGTYVATLTVRGLARLAFPCSKTPRAAVLPAALPPPLRRTAQMLARELAAYHRRSPVRFRVPLDLANHTAFRRRVWQAMMRIPFGETVSYGELARRVGVNSARAVGQACGANPIPLVIPCHRVLAAHGKLGGWSGTPGMKERLLRFEGAELVASSRPAR